MHALFFSCKCQYYVFLVTSVFCIRRKYFLELLTEIGALRELSRRLLQTARSRLANFLVRVSSENMVAPHNVHYAD